MNFFKNAAVVRCLLFLVAVIHQPSIIRSADYLRTND